MNEYKCHWKCPGCSTENQDSIHPVYGPFLSVTCSGCGMAFDHDSLDKESLYSVENAIDLALSSLEED